MMDLCRGQAEKDRSSKAPLQTSIAGETKYRPLVAYLETQDGCVVDCSFAKIEEIIGFLLPRTAHTVAGFWTDRQRPHVRAWTEMGWRAHLDFPNRRVIFYRNKRRYCASMLVSRGT